MANTKTLSSLRTALYLRVSTDDQAREGVSLAGQQDSLIAFCKSQSWHISEIYIDDGYSAKDTNRPDLIRLLKDAENKLFDVVLVWRLDRLTRNVVDLYALLNGFGKLDIGFRSATEPFDTSTALGRMIIGILGIFAQWERENTVERVQMTMRQIAREGRWHGGLKATFGYSYTPGDGILRLNEEEADVVRLIFGLYANERMGYESIARYLNGENDYHRVYATPMRVKNWKLSTVQYILKNPIYTGQMIHKVHGERKLYPGRHEPIISQETFDTVQAIMKERREKQQYPKKNSLLSSLLWCTECGGRMRSKRQWVNWPKVPKKYHHNYVCYNYLKTPFHLVTSECTAAYRHGPKLDKAVLEYLLTLLKDDSLLEDIIKEEISASSDVAQETQKQISLLERQLDGVTQKINRWYSAFEDGTISIDQVKHRLTVLQDQRISIEKELASSRQSLDSLAVNHHDISLIKETIKEFSSANREEAWVFIHKLLKEIWVDRDGNIVKVVFN